MGQPGLDEGADVARAVRVVTDQASVELLDRVNGADRPRGLLDVIQVGHDGLLVRHGDVHAEVVVVGAQSLNGGADLLRRRFPALVMGVEAHGFEGGVVDHRRERMGEGITDDGEEGRHWLIAPLEVAGARGTPEGTSRCASLSRCSAGFSKGSRGNTDHAPRADPSSRLRMQAAPPRPLLTEEEICCITSRTMADISRCWRGALRRSLRRRDRHRRWLRRRGSWSSPAGSPP